MTRYQDLCKQPRRPARELLNLPAPLSIFVEPTNVCNFRCGICPESLANYPNQAGHYKRMPWPTWAHIATQLYDTWEPLKVLRFYFLGEPLLNPDLARMIEMARNMELAERLELTTNASLLRGKCADRLLRSGLDYLRVSVYGTTDAEYQTTTGVASKGKMKAILQNVAGFRKARDVNRTAPWIFAQLTMPSITMEQDLRFEGQWREIADETGINSLHNWGTPDLVHIGPPATKAVCSKPFTELAIRADGKVSVCCIDWNGQLIVGDLKTQTLQEIWNGEPLKRIRQLHLTRRRAELGICADCSLIAQQTDDFDFWITSTVNSGLPDSQKSGQAEK